MRQKPIPEDLPPSLRQFMTQMRHNAARARTNRRRAEDATAARYTREAIRARDERLRKQGLL